MNTQTFNKSLEIASSIFKKSDTIVEIFDENPLMNSPVDYYNNRDAHIQSIVGQDGFYGFNPTVEHDLKADFQSAYGKRDDAMPVYASDLKLSDYERTLARHIYELTRTEHLLENKVHKDIMSWIKNIDELKKKYSSPKLSKTLVKLYGESADIVKWYTNKCPKALSKGKLDNYIITLSILPHHIAGMSYYSPTNHGGDRWINGWDGSSCMDVVRNGGGDAIAKLVPNLNDSFLAIAYLSYADDYDIYNPKYLSRALVRFVNINDNWLMLGCRTYSISNEAQTILIQGLYNEFENFESVYNIRDKYDVYNNILTYSGDNVAIKRITKRECGYCDGSGQYDEDEECGNCKGTGQRTFKSYITPYIDDSDIFSLCEDEQHVMRVALPRPLLEDKGFIEKFDHSKHDQITLAC